MIGALLAVVLLCCGGGSVVGYFALQDVETGDGAAEPVAAVESFLDAIYVKRDAAAATALVCAEANDPTPIRQKVEEIQRYGDAGTRYKWDPPKVEQQDADKAIVSTKVTALTSDDRSASEQLRFTVVHKTGWWVCDVG